VTAHQIDAGPGSKSPACRVIRVTLRAVKVKINYGEGRRQHLLRMANTSGVSANSLDNTSSAESYRGQRQIWSAAGVRHRRSP